MDVYYDANATNDPMGKPTEIPPYEFSDYTQRVIVATAILIASVVGTVGNSLVIIAVLLSKKLRTATNAFVVNLSIADLLTSLFIPWHSVALLSKNGLPVGEWVCSVVAVVVFSTVGCSIYTLASIGLNRLLLITKPRPNYRQFYTPKKIAACLVLTWLIPLLVIILPLLLDVGAVGYSTRYHFCGPDRFHKRAQLFDLIIAVALYPAPLITIAISYTLIWIHLYRHTKRMNVTEETGHSSPDDRYVASRSLAAMTTTEPVNSLPRLSRRQYEITKNMFYIVCAFMLCMTPYAICLFYDGIDPVIPYAAAAVLMNSCINPLIYATKHRDFKTVFGCILRRQLSRIPEPSDCLKTLQRLNCCAESGLSA